MASTREKNLDCASVLTTDTKYGVPHYIFSLACTPYPTRKAPRRSSLRPPNDPNRHRHNLSSKLPDEERRLEIEKSSSGNGRRFKTPTSERLGSGSDTEGSQRTVGNEFRVRPARLELGKSPRTSVTGPSHVCKQMFSGTPILISKSIAFMLLGSAAKDGGRSWKQLV